MEQAMKHINEKKLSDYKIGIMDLLYTFDKI